MLGNELEMAGKRMSDGGEYSLRKAAFFRVGVEGTVRAFFLLHGKEI